MGTLKIRVDATAVGPFADGDPAAAVHEWLDATKQAIGQRAAARLRVFEMNRSKRATGHYQSMIMTTVVNYGDVVVHDPVVYGPWLEGISKRNTSTRFPGYGLWRATRDEVAREAPGIAQAKLADYAARIGITSLGGG